MHHHFSATYAESRRRFLQAANDRGARLESHAHPLEGPEGAALATDVARLGPDDADRVLIVESGLHGPEGHAGAAIQHALLADGVGVPDGVALVLVHAINPWGYAWTRRFNEDNIDLNRHFLDWDNPGNLDNPGYDELADVLVPPGIGEDEMAAAEAVLTAFQEKHGIQAFRAAVKRGQYKHPRGIFYGGLEPSWSARTVARICEDHLAGAGKAALIDIHTGLGPFGFGECLSTMPPDSDEGLRASAWYGEVAHTKSPKTAYAGGSSSILEGASAWYGEVAHTKSPKTAYAGGSSSILEGYRRAAPRPTWTAIGLEFGTRAEKVVRDATRKDAWLYVNGGMDNPRAAEVKAGLLDAFCPHEPEWRAAVVTRGREVVGLGLRGLAAG